jgi:hypothetical protein
MDKIHHDADTRTLLDHHREQLQASGLTDNTIAAAKLYSVTTASEAGRLVNWKGGGPAPALAFQVFNRAGEHVQTVLRPDAPRKREDGSLCKYEQPLGDGHRLYFPPTVDRARYSDLTVPLLLTEGIKKALAAAQAGGAAISAQGVGVWHDVKHKEETGTWRLHCDLAGVSFQGRLVHVAFDGGDTTENPHVVVAEARLARMMLDAGADVLLVRVPFTAGGPKLGIDDHLAKQPDPPAALAELLAAALPADPILRVDRALADAAPERAALALLKDPSFAAALRVADAGVADVVRKHLRKANINRGAVDEALGKFSKSLGAVEAKAAPALGLVDPEPSAEAQSTAEVLTAVRAAFERHVVLPAGGSIALALWVLHTWAFDAARFTPRIALTSPTKRCGKSTVLDLLRDLCRKALPSSNLTAAVLYRAVEMARPTLLVDEADSFLSENEELRGVLNAGYERGASVLRCVGDEFEPTAFNCFAPVAIAAIGVLPGTLADRAVALRMERKPKSVKVKRRDNRAREALHALRPRLARWAKDNLGELTEVEPELPEALNDRQRDICEPLLGIADLAGSEWPAAAREALVKLCGAAEADSADLRERALAAMWAHFQEVGAGFLALGAIVERMLADESAGWDTAARGRPLTTGGLAKWMRGFELVSKQVRQIDGSHPRGYEREAVAPVVARYLPADMGANEGSGGPKRDTATLRADAGDAGDPTPRQSAEAIAAIKARQPAQTVARLAVAPNSPGALEEGSL